MNGHKTFYIDASIPIHVAQAIALVRPGTMYPGAPKCPIEKPKTRDSVWLRIVGQEQWPVIMRDKDIRWREPERRALIDAGVQAFCLTSGGNLNKWDTLKLIMKKWDEIEAKTIDEPGPYVYSTTATQPLRLLPLRY